MKIIQISDTHLSPGKAHFADNWPPLADWIRTERPDLVVHTGDVTVDGADSEVDLRHAAALLRDLGVPVLSVPGNHDVGDAAHPRQPIEPRRLARWRRHFGPDWWVTDRGGWRLIGLDAMLLGSGLEEEAAQADWFERTMREMSGRPVAWFLHRPLFLEDPAEGDTGYWSVRPQPRARLFDLMRRGNVALVASGHLHKAHDFTHDGTRFIWSPASSFLVGPEIQPQMPGEKQLGAALYEFSEASCAVRIVAVPGLTTYWIDDVIDEVYPRNPK